MKNTGSIPVSATISLKIKDQKISCTNYVYGAILMSMKYFAEVIGKTGCVIRVHCGSRSFTIRVNRPDHGTAGIGAFAQAVCDLINSHTNLPDLERLTIGRESKAKGKARPAA